MFQTRATPVQLCQGSSGVNAALVQGSIRGGSTHGIRHPRAASAARTTCTGMCSGNCPAIAFPMIWTDLVEAA